MKKISKKILLLVGGCAVLAVSCILAYFSSSMPVTNPFSIGQANIYLDETFDVDDKWVPGEEKQKEVALMSLICWMRDFSHYMTELRKSLLAIKPNTAVK